MKKQLLFIATFFVSLFISQNLCGQTNWTVNTVGATGFSPSNLTINIGDTVTFVNTGGFHNVNATLATYPSNPEGFGNALSGAWNFQWIFTMAGTYDYQCDPHIPAMVGVINVLAPITPLISSAPNNNPLCFEDFDGDVIVNINQTSPATDVTVKLFWLNPVSGFWILRGTSVGSNVTFSFPGLGFGDYRIDVINTADSVFLDDEFFTLVDPPAIVINTILVTDPSSPSSFDGSIDISSSGGTGSLVYLWSNNAISEDISNLPDGTYDVTVTDDNSCTNTESFTLATTLPPCSAGIIAVDDGSCFSSNDGEISISNASGAYPLTFAIYIADATGIFANSTLYDGPVDISSSTFSFTNLIEGDYFVTFEDDTNCVDNNLVIGSYSVESDGDQYDVATIINAVSDTGSLDGSIVLTVNQGGVGAPYTYIWYDSLGIVIPNSSANTLDSLSVGSYSVAITDNSAFGCDSIFDFVVGLRQACSADSIIVHNVCPGASEGSIKINYLNGWTDFQFYKEINDSVWDLIGDTNSILGLSDSIGGLSAGTYYFILDSSSCPIDTITLEVLEPIIDSIYIVDAVTGNTLCTGDSSRVLVNMSNTDTSLTYWYYTNGALPGQPVGDTSSIYLPPNPPNSSYSIGLQYYNSVGSSSCIGTPGYSFQTYKINEYDLSIEDVFVTDDSCGVSPATLTIETDTSLISNNPLSYSINGATNSTGIFNILHSTIYDTIYVTDSLGCEVYWNANVAPADQIINTTITSTIIKESCRENDGEIHLLVEGGQGKYSFVLSKQIPFSIPLGIDSGFNIIDSIIIDALVSGTYFIKIMDSTMCVYLDTFVVDQVVPFSLLSLTRVKETCCGYDGSIQVNINQGDGIDLKYTLEFDTMAIIIANGNNVYPYTDSNGVWPSQAYITSFSSSQSSPYFDSLTRGYYSIFVEDEYGCVDSADYSDFIASANSGINTHLTIDDSYVIDMSYSYTDVKCFGDTNATLKVLYPDECYIYELFYYYDTTAFAVIAVDSISFPDTSVYYNELYAGIYGIQAMSTSGFVGCVRRTGDFEIIEPDIISYDSPLSTAAYCLNNGFAIDGGACNGTVFLPNSPIGGVYDTSAVLGDTVYQYYINRINSTDSYYQGPILFDAVFTGLCPGDYEVEVLDGNNCIIKDTVTVADSSLYIDSLIVTKISCHDSSDATIQVFSHGGVGAYDYVWTDSIFTVMGSNQIVDALPEGMYSVTVSDITGCNAVDSVFVSSAPDSLYLAGRVPGYKSEETCVGYSYNGYVGYEVEGGSGPYVFNWINSDSTRSGSYTAYAQYCNGCISADNSPFDSVYMLDSLTADIYKVTLSDVNGCPSTYWLPIDSIKITALNINNPLIINSILGSNTLCYGASDGDIVFDMNDSAMSPLIFELDSNLSNPNDSLIIFTSNSTVVFSSLSANTYTVLITDSFGCFIDTSYTITELDEIVASSVVVDLSCYESDDGEVYISFTGGIAPYDYNWIGPNGFSESTLNSVNAFSNITDLTDGTYLLSMTDSFGCLAYNTVEVMPVDTPLLSTIESTTNASCNGYSDASGSISVLGGTRPYQYSWSVGSSTDSTISNVSAGTYEAFITDANGCQDAIELTFEEPLVVVVKVEDISNNLCFGDSLGSITLSAYGGTPHYVYTIEYPSGFIVSTSDYIFDNLIAGNYNLWVEDANDCPSSKIIGEKIGEPGQIELTSGVSDLSCFESNDGSISLNFSGGVAPYQYISNIAGIIETVNVFQGSVTIENLAEGGYDFEVMDYNNCEDNISVTVGQPDFVDADFSIDENLILEGNTVTVTNLSSGANNFSWNFGNNSNTSDEFELTYKYRDQGHFTIELIASNNNLSIDCNDTTSLDIDVEGYDVNNVFSPNNDGVNDEYNFSDEMLLELKVTIYNRWGQQVYGFNDVKGSWNGTGFNGELVPEGVYFFIMEAIGSLGDSYIEEGTITLLR